MTEHMPTDAEVRERFIDDAINRAEVTGFLATLYVTDKARADFDRWLAEVRCEAAEKALREAASAAVTEEEGIPWDRDHDRATVSAWLEDRAASLARGEGA